VDRTVLVSDEEIRSAQRLLWDRLRVVAEPGGAAAFAALMSGRHPLDDRGEDAVIAVVISGANTTAVDFDRP
jgi:threonine dehydratase